ncbi:MAG: hypothetical protein IJ007_09455 [Oscillospiraceae bacterium]|nr:hypothetical protein [Oscillospiraceae bacterium]
MKKRIITIASIAAAVIILGLVFLWVFLPRIMFYNASKLFTAVENGPTEFFTGYDIRSEFEAVTVDNGEFSAEIPDSYSPKDKDMTSLIMYTEPDTKNFISLSKGQDLGLNLLDPSNFEDAENIPDTMGMEQIKQGFEKLGHGLPDSAYSTFKCAHLLEADDYSFWDLEKAAAYSIIGVIKEINAVYGTPYIYETDDICGILSVSSYTEEGTDQTKAKVIFNFYSTDDLNTEYLLYIVCDSPDEAYAVVNSVKIL